MRIHLVYNLCAYGIRRRVLEERRQKRVWHSITELELQRTYENYTFSDDKQWPIGGIDET